MPTPIRTPLRFDSVLPNGQKLRLDMPGARLDGSVEEVMAALAAMPNNNNYKLDVTLTEQVLAAYIAKQKEADALLTFLANLVPGAAGKLNSIGVERAGIIDVFLQELEAHPEFMPADVDATHAPRAATLFQQLRRAKDCREDGGTKLDEAIRLVGHDFMFDVSAYNNNAKLAVKRKVPDAATSVANLKPYIKQGTKKKPTTPTPAK